MPSLGRPLCRCLSLSLSLSLSPSRARARVPRLSLFLSVSPCPSVSVRVCLSLYGFPLLVRVGSTARSRALWRQTLCLSRARSTSLSPSASISLSLSVSLALAHTRARTEREKEREREREYESTEVDLAPHIIVACALASLRVVAVCHWPEARRRDPPILHAGSTHLHHWQSRIPGSDGQPGTAAMMALWRRALEGAGGSSSASPAGSKDRFRCPRGVRPGSARIDRLVLVQARLVATAAARSFGKSLGRPPMGRAEQERMMACARSGFENPDSATGAYAI